jgi:glycosyltransferase involved in cell wall biosynthesis
MYTRFSNNLEMSMKKLLIIMPLYNKEQWIERSIDSILNQTFKNFNLCIVNDCSTDNSLEKIQKYLNSSQIILINNEKNMGAYYSRNVGLQLLEKENYDVYTVHDADDFSDSTRFEKIMKVFENNNTIGVEDYSLRIGGTAPDWHSKEGFATPNHAHAFLSKTAFDIFGYYDNALYGADTEYWKRILKYNQINKKYVTHTLEELLYYAQVNSNSLIFKYGKDLRDEYFKKHMSKIDKMKLDKDFYKSFFSYSQDK